MQDTAHPSLALAPITKTHCPYCALQCGMLLSGSSTEATLSGNTAFPVNKGGLCVKGWTATATLSHPERLRTPLARQSSGTFTPISWDEALERVASAFLTAQTRRGKHAVGLFGGGGLTNEKAYLLGKFARVALG